MIAPPRPARWFRLMAPAGELPDAVALLAEKGLVQLENQEVANASQRSLDDLLERFQRLEERFAHHWPPPRGRHQQTAASPAEIMSRVLTTLETWRDEAEPVITSLQQSQTELWDLLLLEDLVSHLDGVLDFARWREEGPGDIRANLFVLPPDGQLPELPDHVLASPVRGQSHLFLLAAGEHEAMQRLRERILHAKGRHLQIPAWMRGRPDHTRTQIHVRRNRANKKIAGLRLDLTRLADTHQLAQTLADAYRLRWFHDQAQPVSGSHLADLTGWTQATHAEELNLHLRQHGIPALAGLPNRVGDNPPMILENPWWAKPFQIFPTMLGVPGQYEVDPSRLLAILAPLMFGFMFGDVGQGPLLAMAGLVMARRYRMELGWLLVAGGVAATLFGFLFGSLFCLEGILPALWLHPLAHPMTVLAVPLGLGVLVVSAGILLDGLQAHWRGDWEAWRFHGPGLILVYGGVLGLFGSSWSMMPVMAGLGLLLTGGWRHHGWRGALLELAHLPETLMQMGVNTLSFSRVGAFALAHAGLSQAVIALADLTGHTLTWLLVWILGNGIILLLEGLVVAVQTTRLVLFEFFIRFLKGEGRPFTPTPPPLARF